jgi:cell wall-associated NlpC family hydrolase
VHRSILTGIFLFTFAIGAPAIARADETPPAVTSAAPAPANSQQTAVVATSDDAAAPTAGADLAMWNATPVVAPDVEPVEKKPLSPLRRFASGIISRSSAIASSLTRSAMRFIGVPYVFGGTRTTGFDCSGYVQHVFGMNGLHLPRTADAQFDAGRHIRANLVPGDLVFFHTYAPGVSHVGIYLGHNKFIHASSSRGVAVSSLHDRYWAPRFVGAKRVVGT